MKTATEPPVLELQGVDLPLQHRSTLPLVSDVNWSVYPGEYWVVAGLSGSGKSTLLAVAAGLERPLQGAVRIFGLEITDLIAEEWLDRRLKVGIVFEAGSRIFRDLTVFQNLSLPLCYHQDRQPDGVAAELRELLDWMQLTEVAQQTPGRIERRLRSRLGLARALALKPELLLVDNPLASLDVSEITWWLTQLDSLNQGHPWMQYRPVTLIITAHHLGSWVARASHFAVIHDRQWHPLGGPDDLRAIQSCEYQELLSFPGSAAPHPPV